MRNEFNNTDESKPSLPSAEEYRALLQEKGSESHLEAYNKVLEVHQVIQNAGGEAYLVGGTVRDMISGVIPKDFDIEVYGIDPAKLDELISPLFDKIALVGKSFGILKARTGDVEIDVALPRIETKTGEGHKGFETEPAPNLSKVEATNRRDFTINSMLANPETGEIIDLHNGLEDLKNKTLRVTNPAKFGEDPLRVLRALQFISRFDLKIDPSSVGIIKQTIPSLSELSAERIRDEWEKLLLKSKYPSKGLDAGMELGVFANLHPELASLPNTPQEPAWHPEGDVWIHTLKSVDSAVQIARREKLSESDAMVVILAALCHDFGKPSTTEEKDSKIISYGHDQAGEQLALDFLNSLRVDNLTKAKVAKLVANHMTPSRLYHMENKGGKVGDGAIRRLAAKIAPATIEELILVSESDKAGRGPFMDPNSPEQALMRYPSEATEWLLKRARELNVEQKKPDNLIGGNELMALGFEPGALMGEIIKLANELRDEKGMSKEEVLEFIKKNSKDNILEDLQSKLAD